MTAVAVAYKNRMELAMGIAVGSATQISVFVIPFLVIAGWIMDKPMTLNFTHVELILYIMSVIITIPRGEQQLDPRLPPHHVLHIHLLRHLARERDPIDRGGRDEAPAGLVGGLMRAREGGREGGKEGGRGTPSSGVEWVRARLAHLHMYLKRMVMKREGYIEDANRWSKPTEQACV
ncbi:ca2 :cation antiporter family [Nannochloropsis gaditana]|uniref:Ca2: cation antiporter family n=1 Tax=Nannochloropsis gaditana TaxID=72520 RepID=W7TYC3_9STRA|nr:ca2 :cation antiporter family [Nannochloropsis gaditana]